MHALSGTLKTLCLALSTTLTLWTSSIYGAEPQAAVHYEVPPGTPATLNYRGS